MSAQAKELFTTQWENPGDVFSVLLILGGDVVQLALATMTGNTIAPVAFSFGWVAYAISAVVSAIGENRLIRCPPEVSAKVINLKSGYNRDNKSWLLGRVVKTYGFWMPGEVKSVLKSFETRKKDEEEGLPRPVAAGSDSHVPFDIGSDRAALCVAIYKWVPGATPGVPTMDWVYWSGFLVSLLQLGISTIPWGLTGNWGIFLATAGGTILSYASSSLPQWKAEKWHTRVMKKDVALTLGNGTQHVIIILGADWGFDLEALAGGRAPDLMATRVFTSILATLWLVLLITCTGIKSDTWYLLAVGALGMLHNLIVAGVPRQPSSLGLPIELVKTKVGSEEQALPDIFAEQKVMWTLMELEERYKGYGKALVDEFFPGKLMPWEDQWWKSKDSAERRQMLRDSQEELRKKIERKKGAELIQVKAK